MGKSVYSAMGNLGFARLEIKKGNRTMEDRKATREMLSLMAKESLKSNRLRSLFVMGAIALASALLTVILMFAMGQRQRTQNALSHRQQVSFYNLTDGQVEGLGKDQRLAYQIQVKEGVLSELDGFGVMPYYASCFSDEIQVATLETGKMPVSGQEIAVQAALLEKMGIEPAVGSEAAFHFYDGNTESFTVSGILAGGEGAKQFPIFFSESYARTGSQLKGQPFAVYAKLLGTEGSTAGGCKEAMYQIGQDAGIERKNIVPSKAFLDSLSVNMQSVSIYGLIGAVILLASVLVVYGVFYLSVLGKIHQYGQLCTIGMTKKQMKKFVSREGAVLFAWSAPFGVLAGVGIGYAIIPDGFSVKNTGLAIAAVLAGAYGVTMASVRKPAKIAASVSPMEALRYLPQDGMRRKRRARFSWMEALRCLPQDGMAKASGQKMCRSLTPLGLGRINFSKNRKKAGLTMVSLGLGGILYLVAATYMSSFDKEKFARQGNFKDAEFNIFYAQPAVEMNEFGMSGLQAQHPLDGGIEEEISAWDGVKQVTGIKSFGVKFDFPERDEYGTDDGVYPLGEEELREAGAYLEEGSADYGALMGGGYVLVAGNSVVEEVYGWKFAVGDQLVFDFYDGTEMAEQEVTVLGILNSRYTLDHDWNGGWFFMPEQAVLQQVSYQSLNSNLLVSTEPEKEAAVGEKLEGLVAGRPELQMETLAERRIEYQQNADQMFGAISGLAIFIMMFSILSMMNTMVTNIVSRKQELAMLESIGMGKGQVRRMLLGESLFLSLVTMGITMAAGSLCGYALCRMLYKAGAFYMAFQFPAAFALAYAAVLVLVPFSITYASMRSFSKEPLVERLRGMEN